MEEREVPAYPSVSAPEGGAISDAWQAAVRYHELRDRISDPDELARTRRRAALGVLARARTVLGSLVHPAARESSTLDRVPASARSVEIDVDLMLEESAAQLAWAGGRGRAPLTQADIWLDYEVHRVQPVILCVDTSLSMTGEKLALTGVALAVVLLEFREDPVGIVAFENEAFVLKAPDERLSPETMVERFLDVPARGYTHLEEGLRKALRMSGRIWNHEKGRPPSTVLLSDGRFTAGRDPRYLAGRFPHLSVIKMGAERSGSELCRDLARKGRGSLREVGHLESLPGVMYDVVKGLIRGRGTG